MILDENLVGIWFIESTLPLDIMWAVRRADERFEAQGRLRLYDPADPGNDAFSGQDEKVWSRFVSEPDVTEDEAIENMRNVMEELAEEFCGELHEELVGDASIEEFVARWIKNPWVHTKQVATEDMMTEVHHILADE